MPAPSQRSGGRSERGRCAVVIVGTRVGAGSPQPSFGASKECRQTRRGRASGAFSRTRRGRGSMAEPIRSWARHDFTIVGPDIIYGNVGSRALGIDRSRKRRRSAGFAALGERSCQRVGVRSQAWRERWRPGAKSSRMRRRFGPFPRSPECPRKGLDPEVSFIFYILFLMNLLGGLEETG